MTGVEASKILSLTDALEAMKKDFEDAWASGGATAMMQRTRTSKSIKRLHRYVANLLIEGGVDAKNIAFERSITTRFSDKKQDVVVIPRGNAKPTGDSTVSVSVSAQMYGVGKNKDNSFSKARSELFNLHEKHPNIVLAHVQVIAIKGLDSKWAGPEPLYKSLSKRMLAEMIDRYQKINGRQLGGSVGDAERIALLPVDFSQTPPVAYTKISDLERDGFLDANSGLSLDHLTLDDFAPDLLLSHRGRFYGANRL